MEENNYVVKKSKIGTYTLLNGKLHREDGPAVEYANGDKAWYQNDELHRLDGPAIEFDDGDKSWYLKGVKYTEEEWKEKVAKTESKTKVSFRKTKRETKEMKMNNLMNEMLDEVKNGVKLAGSGEAAELMVKTFHKLLRKANPRWADFLSSTGKEFQHLQAVVVAAGLKVTLSIWPNLPKANLAKELVDSALRFEFALIAKPYLKFVSDFIDDLIP